jgi:hypothetical protein
MAEPAQDDWLKIKVSGKSYPTCPDDGCIIMSAKHALALACVGLYWSPLGYCRVIIKGKVKYLQRYILEDLEGRVISAGKVVHHVNEKKFDNRLDNLEVTTQAHNSAATSKKNEKSTSRYKGVCLTTYLKGKWMAGMSIQGKFFHLGYFDIEEDAAKSYDTAFFAIHKSSNGSNDLLTQEEKDAISADYEKYIPRRKRDSRELPKNITKTRNGKFWVDIKFNEYKRIGKQCETLDDAIAFRDETLKDIERLRDQELRKHPIVRNGDGSRNSPREALECDPRRVG